MTRWPYYNMIQHMLKHTIHGKIILNKKHFNWMYIVNNIQSLVFQQYIYYTMIFLFLSIIFSTIGLNSYYSRVEIIVSCKIKLLLCNISCKLFMYEWFWVFHYFADLNNKIPSHLIFLMIFVRWYQNDTHKM